MSMRNELGAPGAATSYEKPNQRVITQLISGANGGATSHDLGNVIKVDPILCYALFVELGSTGAVPVSMVGSCKQAIDVMTLPVFDQWVQAALEYSEVFPRLPETVRNALIRARFMELMGKSAMAREDTEDLYLVGLFSRLHKLLDIPLAELILPLPFSEEMQAAILEQRGRMGRLLKFAETIENADEPGIDFMQTNLRLPAVQVYDAYNEAYDWMGEIEAQYTVNG